MTSTVLNKILYVEDDASIAEVALMTLVDFGQYTVHHCDRGQKALDIVESYRPDLILMDVMMPSMDGVSTMKLLQNMAEAKTIPVIFMTARAQHHEQQEYINAGAKGVLLKPFDPMTLCQDIETIWRSLT